MVITISRQFGSGGHEARHLTERQVDEMDRKRDEYLRVFYDRDWRAPELYDLVLNTARTGIAGAVDLIEWWLGRFTSTTIRAA